MTANPPACSRHPRQPHSTAPVALRQHGGTFLGFVIGLVVGLAIAVTVALFVTRAPIPFVKQNGRAPEPAKNGASDAAKLPDPNKPLYPKDGKAESTDAPPAAVATPATPAAPAAPVPATPPADSKGAPVIDKSTPAAESGEIRQSFLQAGAFKSADEADNMKAKLALLGFEARVMPTERTGTTLYRVRVGPYARAEDLNRVRERLTENGIQPTVVPVGQ